MLTLGFTSFHIGLVERAATQSSDHTITAGKDMTERSCDNSTSGSLLIRLSLGEAPRCRIVAEAMVLIPARTGRASAHQMRIDGTGHHDCQ